jgi:hypothetical protein
MMKKLLLWAACAAYFVLYGSCQTMRTPCLAQSVSISGVCGGVAVAQMDFVLKKCQNYCKNTKNAVYCHQLFYKNALAMYQSMAYSGYKNASFFTKNQLPQPDVRQCYDWLVVLQTASDLVVNNGILQKKTIDKKYEIKHNIQLKSADYAQVLSQKILELNVKKAGEPCLNPKRCLILIKNLQQQLNLSLYKTTKIYWAAAQVADENGSDAAAANVAFVRLLERELGQVAFVFEGVYHKNFKSLRVY